MKQKQNPTIWHLENLISATQTVTTKIGNAWVPCRSIGPSWLSNRIKAAWLVFTGKADAVIWPGNQ